MTWQQSATQTGMCVPRFLRHKSFAQKRETQRQSKPRNKSANGAVLQGVAQAARLEVRG